MLGAVTIVLLSFLLLIIFYNAMWVGLPVLISEKSWYSILQFFFFIIYHNTIYIIVLNALLSIWQLCPLYPHNPEVLLNDLKSPSELLDFGEFSDCMDFGSGSGAPLHVVNPSFDYVPPKLVSLFITDT